MKTIRKLKRLEMAKRAAALAGAMFVFLATSSCARTDANGDGASVNSAAVYTGEVELSIGALESEDHADVFGQVSGLTFDDNGRIFVADAQANQVRVFSSTGELVYAMGRAGAGPGEMDGPCCLAFDSHGLLWVRDGGNARYLVFRPGDQGAEFLRTVRMAHSDVNRWAPVTFDDAGRVIDIGLRPDLSGGELRTARMHLDSSGTPRATLLVHAAPPESTAVHQATRQTPRGAMVRYIYQPYGAQDLVAHSPAGGYAYALSSRYAISWFDDDGKILRETHRDITRGPALSATEKQEAQRRLESAAEFVGATAAALPFGVPDHKPVLYRLFFDTEGRLWVQLSPAAGGHHRADVYEASGNLSHQAEWPSDIDLSFGAIRGNSAVGVAADSLGVQRVVRLHFEPK